MHSNPNLQNLSLSAAKAQLAKATELRKNAERSRYIRDLGGFIVEVLGFEKVDISGIHKPIIGELERHESFVLMLLPRGSYKSTIATVSYPLWRLADNRNLRILIDSQTDHQSRKFLEGIKSHIERNERFRDIFGDWKNIPGWQSDSIVVANRDPRLKDPTIQVGGVNKPVTGGHYDIIICDDLHDDKNSQSPEQCEKVINHWRTLFPILEPDGQMIVIGTRWSPMDLYGFIMQTETCQTA